MGGATDYREILGDSSRHVIKDKGRWGSDVAEIYQRPLLGVQLDASRRVGDAAGADMEGVCAGWCMPR